MVEASAALTASGLQGARVALAFEGIGTPVGASGADRKVKPLTLLGSWVLGD